MSKVMSTFTTKHQFVSNTKIHYPNPSWRTVKLTKWKNCTRRNADENIYRNCKTWAIVATPTILHHHRSHRLPWIDTTILARMYHQNPHCCQEPSLVHCTISRVKRQGKCFAFQSARDLIVAFEAESWASKRETSFTYDVKSIKIGSKGNITLPLDCCHQIMSK